MSREIFTMITVGACAGLVIGLESARYIEALFYHVEWTDPNILALSAGAIFITALIATLPAVLRALSTDPSESLRAE